jgi:hypothetical protein
MKKVFLSVVLLGLLVMPTFVVSAGEKNQWSGSYAYGASDFAEDACIGTYIGFLVTDGRYSYEDSGRGEYAEASIYYARHDTCQGIALLNAYGLIPVTKETFSTHGNLASATLNATIPVTDSLTGQTLSLVARLTWTADGPQQRTMNNEHNNTDGTRINFHGVSIIQPTIVSGSIFLDGSDLIAGQPLDGAMGRGQDLTITVNH